MSEVEVLDSTIFYEETGDGIPFVFLHGNPSSSYLWRNVLPRVSEIGRCLAPDLIGMGSSGKPDVPYRFADHARYLDAWFDELALDDVILVGHDWGGALAFDWATRHPGKTRTLVFMETILRPMSWDEFPAIARSRFEAFRTPEVGETLVLNENAFIERSLSTSVLSGLSDQDLEVYRKPYPSRNSRRPLLEWPRAMPLDGEPADVVSRVEAYDDWLARSEDVPKLLLTFNGSPTLMIGSALTIWCAENIANLEVEHCGAAGHLAPEDQPEAIAAAIVNWANQHRLWSTDAAKESAMISPPTE